MTAESKNAPCEVCGGKGGWYAKGLPKVDENYTECLQCEGNGFYLKAVEPEANQLRYLLVYNTYRKLITEKLEEHGRILRYLTEDGGKSIRIDIVPYDKENWLKFVKTSLKFSHFSQNLTIKAHQDYYYKPEDDRHYYFWAMILETDDIRSLDGFVSLLSGWHDRGSDRYGK